MPTQLKNYLANPNTSNTMSPGELSGFLADFWALFLKLHSGVAKNEERLTSAELEKINDIIKELSENFFPMAHSQEPLERLAIVEKQKILDLENHSRMLTEELSRIIDIVSEQSRRNAEFSDEVSRIYQEARDHSLRNAHFNVDFSRAYLEALEVTIQQTHEKIANLSDDVHL